MSEPYISFLLNGLYILFYVLLFAYSLYGVIFAYHWFTYGINRHISSVALVAYLCGGALLFLTYSLALNTL